MKYKLIVENYVETLNQLIKKQNTFQKSKNLGIFKLIEDYYNKELFIRLLFIDKNKKYNLITNSFYIKNKYDEDLYYKYFYLCII